MNDKKVEPRIPKGFMELLPEDQILFNRMFETIRSVYERYGFTPIETPALEFTQILLAKGGGETDKQVYRMDKAGDDLSLHFDLTVPLARYVAQYQEFLTFPFRRYQMQKVWRGERNQRHRFREFYQCDIDVIGTTNVLVDAEIPGVMYEVFRTLGFGDITIRFNNRKILNGFMNHLALNDQSEHVLHSIDNLEKQGEEKVVEGLATLGISREKISKLMSFIKIDGSNQEILDQLEKLGVEDSLFLQGLSELKTVAQAISKFGVPDKCNKIDLSTARGLDYYTGTVYETVLTDYPKVGSVCSGGRFDNLAEYYTDKKLPGVGMSIGLTRLFDKLKTEGLISTVKATPSKVLIVQAGIEVLDRCLEVASRLRQSGINTEVYLERDKIGKQLRYADRLKIPFVIIIGENEVTGNTVTVKVMPGGAQSSVTLDEAIQMIKR